MSSFVRRLTLAAVAILGPLAAACGAEAVAINPQALYPEGPLAVGDSVYYAEMGSDSVVRWDGKTNSVVWSRPGCGPTSVASGGEGTLIVLCHHENALVRIGVDGATRAVITRDAAGLTFMDPNASINDARGGVYFSSSGVFSPTAPAQGAVLYLDSAGRLTRLAEGIHYSNGVALTPDGKTLYVSEHLSRRILAYDVAADGGLSGKRIFVALDDLEGADPLRGWELGPDGLAVDRAGNLYMAEYGGGRLLIVDSQARLLAVVPVGEPYVTAMALIDGGRRLFVTAPASLYDPSEPGKVYSLDNPVWRGK